jgi:hypothetical protein
VGISAKYKIGGLSLSIKTKALKNAWRSRRDTAENFTRFR